MNVSLKNEFILGVFSICILVGLIGFYVFRYNQKTIQLSSNITVPSVAPDIILTTDVISQHSASQDCWLIIESKVYDATDFLSRHPGGGGLILPYCGHDATEPFMTQGGRGSHSQEAMRILGLLYVGDLNGKATQRPNSQTTQSLPIRGGDDD